MKALFENGCTQFWFNAQNMDKKERKSHRVNGCW